MKIKKLGSMIYGAALSPNEKLAMDREIHRQLIEYDRKHRLEIQALVLWQLHEQLGFGKKRLKEFHDRFDLALDGLIERYQLAEEDAPWVCTLKLKDIGVDISEWEDKSLRKS